jgi:SARP family transcriptional regulator, regulator of embCAB operon
LAARLYLLGRTRLEDPAGTLTSAGLPGRQGPLALTYLALARDRPVPRDELADAVWGDEPPPSQENALRALVSKLRAALSGTGAEAGIPAEAGCYRLVLPPGAWIDVETAVNRVDRAEGRLRDGDPAAAWSEATVAETILRRPLLAGEESPWLTAARERLEADLLRALDVLSAAWLEVGQAELAVRAGSEAVRLAPFREAGYRALMRAHLASGDRAEAVRVYGECRSLLGDELGVSPSSQTEQIYLEALNAPSRRGG